MSGTDHAAPPSLAAWAWPERGPVAADKAAYIARADVLQQVGRALRAASCSALLVKGSGLTHLYAEPWLRPMSDIDLLVRNKDLSAAVAALVAAGFSREPSQRRLTESVLEIPMYAPPPSGTLVELHTSMDKVVQRPVDLGAVFSRARPSENDGLLLPSLEDQLLFVVQHLGSDEFRHATGMVDLQVLLEAGVDLEMAAQRARQWQSRAVLYVALAALQSMLGERVVPNRLLQALRPRSRQLALIKTHFNIGSWPVAKRPTRLGPRWMYGQVTMRDEPLAFIAGLGVYAVNRVRETLQRAP